MDLTRAQVESRNARQFSEEEKIRLADYVICNDDSRLVIPQVLDLHRQFLALAGPMILDDFLCFDASGLYCKYGGFYLDPQQPVSLAVVSHAHADHAISGSSQVYCTEATAAFMQLRYGKNAAKAFQYCPL